MKTSETMDVSCAGGGEAIDGSQDANCDNAVQRSQVRFRLGRQNDALDHEGSW
jgi:hypothetical protein